MSEREQFDVSGCWYTVVAFAILLLIIHAVIDTYAGHRDVHHIRDLQHRIGQLEQEKGDSNKR